MIDALQGLLISGEDCKRDVSSGKKKLTIKKGHWSYHPGPVLIGNDLGNWVTLKTITDVRHTTVKFLRPEEIHNDGFKDRLELIERLSEFYPDFNPDTPVTVIHFM